MVSQRDEPRRNGPRWVLQRQLLLSLIVCICLTGCDSGPEIAPFSGTVKFRGQPLQFGSVMFQPVDGGHPSTGQIQPDGTFVMKVRGVGEGAYVGKNRVRITCYPAQDQRNQASAKDELPLGNSLIPTQYANFGSSGLSIDVKPGSNEPYTFELTDE